MIHRSLTPPALWRWLFGLALAALMLAPALAADTGQIRRADVRDDIIGEDEIDFGFGADQVSAADVPVADTGAYFSGINVEAVLAEIGSWLSIAPLYWQRVGTLVRLLHPEDDVYLGDTQQLYLESDTATEAKLLFADPDDSHPRLTISATGHLLLGDGTTAPACTGTGYLLGDAGTGDGHLAWLPRPLSGALWQGQELAYGETDEGWHWASSGTASVTPSWGCLVDFDTATVSAAHGQWDWTVYKSGGTIRYTDLATVGQLDRHGSTLHCTVMISLDHDDLPGGVALFSDVAFIASDYTSALKAYSSNLVSSLPHDGSWVVLTATVDTSSWTSTPDNGCTLALYLLGNDPAGWSGDVDEAVSLRCRWLRVEVE